MTKNAQRSKSYLPEILLFVGITLVVISTVHNVLRLQSLRLDQQTVAAYVDKSAGDSQVAPVLPIPTHIFIKWYVDVAIEPSVYQRDHWTISDSAGSYLLASAKPGEGGNIIVYGHNKRSILGNIRALKGYETISLGLSDGTTRDYKVASMSEVSPKDTRLLQPTNQEVLTIYTCSGLLDSRRFVVRAIPVSDPSLN